MGLDDPEYSVEEKVSLTQIKLAMAIRKKSKSMSYPRCYFDIIFWETFYCLLN